MFFVSFRVCYCVCFIFVRAAFVRIKLMMMMIKQFSKESVDWKIQ